MIIFKKLGLDFDLFVTQVQVRLMQGRALDLGVNAFAINCGDSILPSPHAKRRENYQVRFAPLYIKVVIVSSCC